MRRFYSPDTEPGQESLTLSGDESAHIRNVLRLREGERISVFDGRGGEYLCEISTITKRETRLSIVARTEPPSKESHLDLTLAVALLKHEKFDLVIQKAVELGVTSLVPILTSRCDIPAKAAGSRFDRWRRIVVEASKQCGRATLMNLGEVTEFEDCLNSLGSEGIMFVERGGTGFPARASDSITAFVGPEGGWEESEIQKAGGSGVILVTLAGRILRAETAAITAAALVQHRFGDLR